MIVPLAQALEYPVPKTTFCIVEIKTRIRQVIPLLSRPRVCFCVLFFRLTNEEEITKE